MVSWKIGPTTTKKKRGTCERVTPKIHFVPSPSIEFGVGMFLIRESV